MNKILVFALCSVSVFSANASDSDWKLCKGDTQIYGEQAKLVVNVFEHRTAGGRAADITLIYGGHTLKGSLNTSFETSGKVKLKEGSSQFSGTASVDYQAQSINLKGKLILNKSTSEISTTLECETL